MTVRLDWFACAVRTLIFSESYAQFQEKTRDTLIEVL